ncbi:Toxin SpoIISA, type II toxin-antitoxin system [Terribacillus saccharophilus]|uniref:Toxin SpoIISA, type II toxin-antitoxin system n=1 Tax=Terribacillus saccharophilus TaxID=361277 RepID=A0AAX2EJM1_9BACI|nr:Toxin SpoIISA, type II toxin-antitoxin system [Terribacillus saccharophilus]
MAVTGYMIAFLILVLVGIAISIVLYIWDKNYYLKHRVAIRKIYYFIIVLGSCLLWMFGLFPNVGTNLQYLIAIVIGVVIIDLFVFQTPDITKFMTNELKQETLVEKINKNYDSLSELSNKLIKVNEMMPRGIRWEFGDFDYSAEAYEDYALDYLRNYTDEFKLEIYSYFVESSEASEVFNKNVEKAYKLICKEHDLDIRGVGMREKRAIRTLIEGKNIEILDKNGSSVVFPYFGEFYNFLFVVTTKDDNEVMGADASLLLNLLYTFDAWLVAYQDEILEEEEDEEDEEGLITRVFQVDSNRNEDGQGN